MIPTIEGVWLPPHIPAYVCIGVLSYVVQRLLTHVHCDVRFWIKG